MKDYAKGVATQLTAIILAGLAAAGIAFVQTLLAKTGACDLNATTPTEVGFLGAALKAAHWGVKSSTVV